MDYGRLSRYATDDEVLDLWQRRQDRACQTIPDAAHGQLAASRNTAAGAVREAIARLGRLNRLFVGEESAHLLLAQTLQVMDLTLAAVDPDAAAVHGLACLSAVLKRSFSLGGALLHRVCKQTAGCGQSLLAAVDLGDLRRAEGRLLVDRASALVVASPIEWLEIYELRLRDTVQEPSHAALSDACKKARHFAVALVLSSQGISQLSCDPRLASAALLLLALGHAQLLLLEHFRPGFEDYASSASNVGDAAAERAVLAESPEAVTAPLVTRATFAAAIQNGDLGSVVEELEALGFQPFSQ